MTKPVLKGKLKEGHWYAVVGKDKPHKFLGLRQYYHGKRLPRNERWYGVGFTRTKSTIDYSVKRWRR